jgi:hypothetical protein
MDQAFPLVQNLSLQLLLKKNRHRLDPLLIVPQRSHKDQND